MKIKALLLLLLTAAVLTACTHEKLLNRGSSTTEESGDALTVPEEETENGATDEETEETESPVTVTVTSEGFNPKSVTVTQGETVVWRNETEGQTWVASAVHPTHQVYPGFDQLKGMGKGETYSFTFEKIGTWKYHDHLNPTRFGEVVVTE
ncbi:hypothetical protein A2716_02025 [candidate division WWE3 bacterium RIFCSPHIGHO2_01_FULL_40_23]|uniref:EfeO-type cupredoxin-like domain-containing protein n=1 Tax=candidate division WWE3 bacterium RIFCSPLOWO2_01_FULL_41_18 TaxID=1802625 RepID=A0A1F4VEZ9_UNCKA|nr:MAG: hypothetical protein A2716_02025 [candidate division WWE3 bacterium RIFCSPHIGHO2_01_FULL_40_23]OGC55767.1 MAG: hypothetical protein A3A78_01875 [candidate division WWE3 bacterium RIFCSPLOWO2_01_FULL_41_18]